MRTVLVLCAMLLAGSALAHPVPKDNHDRTAIVRLTPAGVRVAVRFEVDKLTAEIDLIRAKHPGLARLTTRDELAAIYADYLAERLADYFTCDLDKQLLPLRLVTRATQVTDHIRCEFTLEATWPDRQPGAQRFVFRDVAWEDDEASKIVLSLDATPGIELLHAEVPDLELLARPAGQWLPGDRERRRTLRAAFIEVPRRPPGRYRPALPPDLGPERSVNAHGTTLPGPGALVVAESRPGPGWATSKREDAAPPLPDAPATPAKPTSTLRGLLLDSNVGLGLLLLLAALFGAAHALTPGHGKTMVAAYLVGERGTIGHAILLGIVTTLTHTFAVLVLAALLPFLIGREQNVQTALEFIGGLLIAGMGIFLLLRRVSGQSDHVHLFNHSHAPVSEGTTVRWLDLILLGIAGGIVPCWDAIAMLGLAIASGRLWLGFPLLLAFSAGLAFVLVAIGIGVVLTRKVARPHLERHKDTLEVVGRVLPLVTALVITVLGLWLCYDALHGGHAEVP